MKRQAITSAAPLAFYLKGYASAGGRSNQWASPIMHVIAMPTNSIRALFCGLAIMLALGGPTVAAADVTAKEIYEATQNLVFQIRVVDVASGDKYSIGSGFLVSEDGYLATNFHVVASFVYEPHKYRLEYELKDGGTGALSLIATDVVNDLALLVTGKSTPEFLPLATKPISKGDRIYSMGNPRDLGMTIIEGTYNGLVEESRLQKILFSGSLNPGMSGGPALNAKGEVVGINVSKAGEQISFLVPVSHLAKLMKDNASILVTRDHRSEITAALLAEQEQFFRALLDSTPTTKPMGSIQVPGKLLESLNCWGHTVDEEYNHFQAIHQHCKSEDQIYVSDSVYVGDFYYDYELISTDELNRFQFYHLLESFFDHGAFSNISDKDLVTDIQCYSDVVRVNEANWKISTCLRGYREHEGLYDASMAMVSIDFNDIAAVINMGATGVSAKNALAVFKHISGAVSWTR